MPKKTRSWHEDLMNRMLQHPEHTGRQLAAHFAVSEAWLYTLKNSDIFQARFQERKGAIETLIDADIVQRAGALAEITFDVMQERVERERDILPLKTVREVSSHALGVLGYNSPRGDAGPVVQVNIVNQQMLADARANMRRVQAQEVDDAADLPSTTIGPPLSAST